MPKAQRAASPTTASAKRAPSRPATKSAAHRTTKRTAKKSTPPPAETAVECAAPECSNTFVPKHPRGKYCGTTCRQRAARARRAADAAAVVDAAAEAGDAEHGLVRATRLELEKADALDTVDGQIALQLARKLIDPNYVTPGLAKELRATLAAAKGLAEPPGGDGTPAEPEDDELDQARKAREKAREAAGL